MKRYFIIFKGRVQGVGFRWRVLEICNNLHLTGYVRNLENGDVQAQIQGEKEDLDDFFKQIYKPNRFIRIDDYSIRQVPINEKEKKFTVQQ